MSTRSSVPLVPMESARLTLPALTLDDAAEVFGIIGHKPTVHAVSWGQPTLEAATGWVRRRIANETQHGYSMWGVARLGDPTLVGLCGFFPTQPDAPAVLDVGVDEEVELGYVIQADHQGRGWATEAAQAATNAMLGTGRQVFATIRSTNAASLAVAAKIGLEPDGHIDDDRGRLLVMRTKPQQ